jgi:FG-GAP-like repeat
MDGVVTQVLHPQRNGWPTPHPGDGFRITLLCLGPIRSLDEAQCVRYRYLFLPLVGPSIATRAAMRIRVAIAALVWLCSPALCQNPTFLPAVNYPVQGDGWIATGDFNGDSNPDLVVANQDNTVSISLGNGDGTFQTQRFVTVPQFANYVAVGDFNADNKADLAVISVNNLNFSVPSAVQGAVYILLGNGNGTFGAAASVATATLPRSLTVGDVNHDNVLDLVVANQGDGTVTVLLGNGNGTFKAAVSYPAGSSPEAVAIGDVRLQTFLRARFFQILSLLEISTMMQKPTSSLPVMS